VVERLPFKGLDRRQVIVFICADSEAMKDDGGLKIYTAGNPRQIGEKMMKAKVDQDTCTGCGLCVDTCPEVFEMGDDTAKVIADPVPAAAVESCKEAAADCPVEAIAVE